MNSTFYFVVNILLPTNTLLFNIKFTLKHFFTVTPTCFGRCGPSPGSLYWAWPKLLLCRYNQ